MWTWDGWDGCVTSHGYLFGNQWWSVAAGRQMSRWPFVTTASLIMLWWTRGNLANFKDICIFNLNSQFRMIDTIPYKQYIRQASRFDSKWHRGRCIEMHIFLLVYTSHPKRSAAIGRVELVNFAILMKLTHYSHLQTKQSTHHWVTIVHQSSWQTGNKLCCSTDWCRRICMSYIRMCMWLTINYKDGKPSQITHKGKQIVLVDTERLCCDKCRVNSWIAQFTVWSSKSLLIGESRRRSSLWSLPFY